MNKILSIIRLSMIFIVISSITVSVHGVSANPFPHQYTQPCGTVIEYVLVGDESFHYMKTPDGCVITLDSDTGYFYYAQQVDFLILPTDIKAGVDSVPDNALTPDKLVRADTFNNRNIKICIDGEYLDTDDLISVESNAVYLPLRLIFENLGFTVDWEDDTKTVMLSNSSYDNFNAEIQPGSDSIILNGMSVYVENCSEIINSRTLLPLSIFTKILGSENVVVTIEQEDITISFTLEYPV